MRDHARKCAVTSMFNFTVLRRSSYRCIALKLHDFIRTHMTSTRIAKKDQGGYLHLLKPPCRASLREICTDNTVFQNYVTPETASGHVAYKPLNCAKNRLFECAGAPKHLSASPTPLIKVLS